MFGLNENYEVDRRILKCDYIRYSPAEASTINTPNSQIYINMPREHSVISLLNSYLDLNFEVIKKADNSRYANGNDIRLVKLGPIALFSIFKLTASSGKHLEDISQGHLVSLMYKLITSSKDGDDLSIGFDRNRNRRDELAENKNMKGNYHLRIMLEDIFVFAEQQEKATHGLGYKLTLTLNKDETVIDKAAGIADARIKIDHIHWYVPHYTLSTQQQGILSKQILSKIPKQLRYVERSVFMKEVNNHNLWNFELGSQERMNVPIWIIILGFHQRDRQDSQILNNDTFCRLPVTSAQCIIGTESYPDSGIIVNYDDDDYSQGYSQIIEVFRALTKDNILTPFISDDNFTSSNVRADDFGYNIYAFDKRYQQIFTASQPIKVEFKFDGVISNDINGYALVLTNKLVFISSDGQRHFDLVQVQGFHNIFIFF